MGHGDGPSTAIAPSIPPGIRTPSGFVENIGQIVDRGGARRPDILYALSDGPTAIFLRRGAISYVLHGVPAGSDRGMCGYRMDVELVGADPAARVTAEEPTGGWSSYYRGGAEGATRLPRFRRVVYHDIYPGIDMAFSHDSSGVKYDFIVHPGGDPGNIALRYIGADSLVREPSGMLNAAVPLGVLREGAPFTYQPAGGNARQGGGSHQGTAQKDGADEKRQICPHGGNSKGCREKTDGPAGSCGVLAIQKGFCGRKGFCVSL